MEKSRNSSIELLRIIAGIGVIILHYNNAYAGGGFKYVDNNSINQYWLFLSETISICAVDLFILISAYFLSMNNKRDICKVFSLILQFIIFQKQIHIFSARWLSAY